MSKWRLNFTPEAETDLEKLDKKLQRRIIDKLDWLLVNFDKIVPSALGGSWQGYFKLRVGDWRILYKIDWSKDLVIVYLIDRRDKIYKRRV